MNDKRPMLIFVAGPYSNESAVEREANTNKIHAIVKSLLLKGHFVLECHSLEHAFYADDQLSHLDFLRLTLHWQEKCDALFLGGHSPGADLELSRARSLGLAIFTDLEQVPDVEGKDKELVEIANNLKKTNSKLI